MNKSTLVIKNLDFSYDGKKKVLEIASFSLNEKEKVFLKGPSGSGKTTLLNLIGGVLEPQKGSIQILENDFHKMSKRQKDQFRADNMGFIFQNLNLIPYISPLDNVLLPLSFSEKKKKNVEDSLKEAKHWLEELGIKKDIYEKKYSTDLSQGQQQRVAVARAMMGRPRFIIADEPTSALDADNREKFLNLLNHLASEIHSSVLFVSHDSSLEKYFDRSIDLREINRMGGDS